MSYQGYLLKINGIVFPKRLIKIETYNIAPNQKQTIDAYVDGNGYFHQTILPHRRSKIEFETPALKVVDTILINAMFDDNDTAANIEYYNPKTDSYHTGTAYLPDITYTIVSDHDGILYNPIRIAIIEN